MIDHGFHGWARMKLRLPETPPRHPCNPRSIIHEIPVPWKFGKLFVEKMRCRTGTHRYFRRPNPTMADQANKYPENVSGKFYVDDQCIDCDLCRETAPANFKRNDDGGHSFLYKQAENPDEEKLCKEAMEGCPVEAIGSDGE